MSKKGLTVALGMALLAPGVAAQDEEEIIFAQYFRCNQAMEAQADEAVRNTFGPVIQRHVDAGHITGWVWLTHSQGGAWRRILATTGTDVNQMMEVREQIVGEMTEQNADALEQLFGACPGHDDYIWFGIETSGNDPDVLGNASISSYHMCDRSRESRADEIFTNVLAPLYKKHRDMGHLSSYGFFGHRTGGVFRRLETVSGPDHATVLAMQGAIYAEAGETNPIAMQEFSSICQTHTDYMWTNSSN